MISGLNLDEREELAELTSKLNEVVQKQNELDKKTRPLNEELANLEMEEKNLDDEYEGIYASTNLEDMQKSANITEKMVEIANRKREIETNLNEYEPEFKQNNSLIEEYKKKIEFIVSLNKEGVLGNGVTYLNAEGKVVNSIDEVNVKVEPFVKPTNKVVVNMSKNQIIETKKNVSNFIKEAYNKVSNLMIDLKSKKKELVDFINKKVEDAKTKYNEYYEQEEQRVNEIIDSYRKEKELKDKVEEAADNLELYNSNQVEEEKENIDQALYMDNKELSIPVDVIEKNSPEIDNAVEVVSNVVNNDVLSEENNQINNEILSEETNEKVEEIQNNIDNENDKLFKNIDKYDEELQRMQKESKPHNNIIQKVSVAKSKIAKAKSSKIFSMQKLFNNGLQYKASLDANRLLSDVKKSELEEAKARLEEAREKAQNDYIDSVNEINNMGSMKIA